VCRTLLQMARQSLCLQKLYLGHCAGLMMIGKQPASTSSTSNACIWIKMHTQMCSLTWRLDICCFPKPYGVWTRYVAEIVGPAKFVKLLGDNSSHASAFDSWGSVEVLCLIALANLQSEAKGPHQDLYVAGSPKVSSQSHRSLHAHHPIQHYQAANANVSISLTLLSYTLGTTQHMNSDTPISRVWHSADIAF